MPSVQERKEECLFTGTPPVLMCSPLSGSAGVISAGHKSRLRETQKEQPLHGTLSPFVYSLLTENEGRIAPLLNSHCIL